MQAHLQRIAELIRKHSTETLSDQEKEELSYWQSQYPIIQEWMDHPVGKEKEIEDRFSKWLEKDISSDWYAIEQKAAYSKPASNKRKYGFAAASVIVAITIGIWFFNIDSTPIEQTVEVFTDPSEAVLPGKNKAVLTLSDGTEIFLEEGREQAVQDGSLALSAEGNTLDYSAQQALEVYQHKLKVPLGGTYQLQLSDGTKVWLNADSELEFPSVFNGDERMVKVKGEAYFEIAKDPLKPFRVQVNETVVEALGTAFNINTHMSPDKVKTILTEGKIRVSAHGKEEIVKSGYAAYSGKQGVTVEVTDIEEALAWKDGYFYFDSKNLKYILEEIARWYDVELHIEKPISQEKYKGGIKRTESIGAVCNILMDLTGYVIEINNRILTVKKTV